MEEIDRDRIRHSLGKLVKIGVLKIIDKPENGNFKYEVTEHGKKWFDERGVDYTDELFKKFDG